MTSELLLSLLLTASINAVGTSGADTLTFRSGKDSLKIVTPADTVYESATALTLTDAIKIALSENVSVKVADKEIRRYEYAKKGTYAALYPQIDASGTYQRTLQKQVMYMDSGSGGSYMSSITDMLKTYLAPLYAQHPDVPIPEPSPSSDSSGGMTIGRWNTWSVGVSASMPIVNAALWESLKISGQDVEIAVEKARSSRLSTVEEVKHSFFAVLLAKELANVYREVYNNALANYENTLKKYNAGKASDLDLTRVKTTLASSIPDLFTAESDIVLAQWKLKAVMGVDLDENIDASGSLKDYTPEMMELIPDGDNLDVDRNTTMKQLAIQAEQLANTVKLQKYAYIPTLALGITWNYSAYANDFQFNTYQWTPYSYVGLSLSIPIFSGGRRLSNVRQSQVAYSELALTQADTERQLKISIRQCLNQMENAVKGYDSAESAQKTAQKAYDIAYSSYSVGRSTLTDLNDAQLALTQAQLQVMRQIYSYVYYKATLEQILGNDFTE